MVKKRVLVVDDTVVIRRLLSEVINRDPDLEVCGIAPNGKVALMKLPHLNPDIITLDIEMPEMDGLATLREIRKIDKKTPIIMLSSLTRTGADQTFQALSLGATDYLLKPSNLSNFSETIAELEHLLIPKIKALFPKKEQALPLKRAIARKTADPVLNKLRKTQNQKIDILCIGTSTGGPIALETLVKKLQKRLTVPTVIVQHMPPVFTKSLAERLDRISPNSFFEGEENQVLENGCVYIAPGGKHMEVRKDGTQVKIHLHEGIPENSCRPAVDVLFRSVANVYRKNVLGIILTGMGQDGLRGCNALVDAGGSVYSQDKSSSVIWGMPKAISDANLAEKILPLKDIPEHIYDRLP